MISINHCQSKCTTKQFKIVARNIVKTGVRTRSRNCFREEDGKFGHEGRNGVQKILMALGI